MSHFANTAIMEKFLHWLIAHYGINALFYYDMPVYALWIYDELYEDGIITDADLEGHDPKLVYALVFDHQKPIGYREDNTEMFPIDVFTAFLINIGYGDEIIGRKQFYSLPDQWLYWEKEAYLLITKDFLEKIRVPVK